MARNGGGLTGLILLALVAGWAVSGSDDQKPSASQANTGSITQIPAREAAPSPSQVKTASLDAAPANSLNVLKPENNDSFKARTMFVDADRLNVRNGAGKNHKTIWTLKRDQAVNVVGQDGEWLHVEGERFSGWVFATFLTPHPKPKKKNPPPQKNKPKISDSEIVNLLIRRSLSLYSGNCPCPYNRTRTGRKCGGRSAYSRPGGASPLCYPRDVPQAMINDYRSRL